MMIQLTQIDTLFFRVNRKHLNTRKMCKKKLPYQEFTMLTWQQLLFQMPGFWK